MTKKPKYKVADMVAALVQSKGMVYLAAQNLGCTAQTVYNYRDKHPSVKDAIEQQDGMVDDAAEIKLMQAINKGEAWAIKFRLATKARHRGYVERQEVESSGAVTFKVVYGEE